MKLVKQANFLTQVRVKDSFHFPTVWIFNTFPLSHPKGAVECSPRQPCVEDDYFYSFTPCTPEGRNKIYEFAQPMICDASDFTLPENENNVACAACNPGI